MKNRILSALLLISAIAFGQPSANYYTASTLDGKNGRNLELALKNIVYIHTQLGYNALWNAYLTTDPGPIDSIPASYTGDKSDLVYDMYAWMSQFPKFYSDKDHTQTGGINREHSVPNSWWGGESGNAIAYTDLHHLVPSDGCANSAKSNWPLGEYQSGMTLSFPKDTKSNSDGQIYVIADNQSHSEGKACGISASHVWKVQDASDFGGASLVFEPADEYKGDFARMYLYVVCAYEGELTWKVNYMFESNANNQTTILPWAKDLLLRWHRQDPVSQKELDRNNAVDGLQKNRNPFIDYPELVEYIWGNKSSEKFNLSKAHLAYNKEEIIDPEPDEKNVYNSLEELVAADLKSGDTVTVSFANVPIKSFYTASGKYRNGIYFDIQKEGKDIEIYFKNVPGTWEIGGTVSGTITSVWKQYNGTWELAPSSTWSWTNLTYMAKPVWVETIAISGHPATTTYTEGETFSTEGLQVWATYNTGDMEEVTDDVQWTFDASGLTKGALYIDVQAEYDELVASKRCYIYVKRERPTVQQLFYESFDQTTGLGGDTIWSGSIANKQGIKYDNTGWESEKDYCANKCGKYGTGKDAGQATTPALTIPGGAAKLVFKAAGWAAKNEKKGLKLSCTSGTLSDTLITLTPGQWTVYTVYLRGAGADTRITFSAENTASNRFFLDSVVVESMLVDTLTMGEDEWRTYYTDEAFVMPAGMSGYIIEDDGIEQLVEKYQAGDKVAAYTPLLLHAEPGRYEYTICDNGETMPTNRLRGQLTAGPVETSTDQYYYIFERRNNLLGFYLGNAEGDELVLADTNSAYLTRYKSDGYLAEVRFTDVWGAGPATNAYTPDAMTDSITKVLRNGNIYILRQDYTYTLMGELVQ